MSARTRFVAVFLFVGGLTLVPFKSLDCPAWAVTVVDQSARPMPGMTVRLSYRNYSAEVGNHEVDRTTDERGHATFPVETLSASLARRLLFTLMSARAGIHAGYGPHANVFAFGKGLEGFDVDTRRNVMVEWTGRPSSMASRIVVTRP
jgi:hypothetical protein